MEKTANQRQCRRQTCEAAIQWTYFNQGEFRCAIKRNDGRKGFYFESPSCPKLNATIFIKPGPGTNPGNAASVTVRTAAVARVRWIKTITSGDTPLYGIGAEYFDNTLDPYFPNPDYPVPKSRSALRPVSVSAKS